MGFVIDTKSKEFTARRALNALSLYAFRGKKPVHPERRFALLLNVGTGTQLVAVLQHDVERERTKVVKYRANSGRWTSPGWVPTKDLIRVIKDERRYGDALASLHAAKWWD